MIYFIILKPNDNILKAKKGLLDSFLPKKEMPEKEQIFYTNKIGENLPFEGQHPHCKICEQAMNLIIQIDDPRIVSKPTLIFQCQNDPGMCEDWDADSGGNKVIHSEKLQQSSTDLELALEFLESRYTDDELKTDHYKLFYELNENKFKGALIGKVHGEPIWIQSEETPSCCNQLMKFVLQISGIHVLNFADSGEGYLFECKTCRDGKFLWQSV